MLELALLGHPQINLDGRRLTIASNKSQALLYFLALNDRPYSRTALAGLLWGSKAEGDARRNLRVELSKLRRTLPGYLLISHTTVGFNHEQACQIDVALLRTAAQDPYSNISGTKKALALIRGELLEDLHLLDAQEFEAWLIVVQEECRRLQRTLLQAMISHGRDTGAFREALTYARSLLDLEPWREETHRLVMLFLAQLGQRSAALAQFETCRQTLATELGVEPSPETLALLEEIRSGRLGVSPAPKPVPPPEPPNHNLPAATTTFVGRLEEMAQVRELLSRPACRLLTLLGPGGIGKSRLAQEVGRSWVINPAPLFAGGIYYVPLAETNTEAGVILAITKALGLSLASNAQPRAQLLENLQGRQLLLILDNLEQLVDQSGLLVDLLASAKDLKILVTSRQRLPILESWNYDLPGLKVPSIDSLMDPIEYSAVQLFVERARRLDLGFDVSAEAVGIARICQLVDGLPLGIELAAAWVRGFSCEQIADRITQDLDLLLSSSPGLPVRHRSLRAAFAHSWELLSPEEQVILANLSIFAGGFSWEAAEVVAGASRRLILNLVDKSLVRRSPADRYDLHQVLRQLAREKVPSPDLNQLRASHAGYFVRYLHEHEAKQGEVIAQDVVDEISSDLDNIRKAWSWSISRADEEQLRLATDTLARYYANRSYFIEGEEQFGRAAEAVPTGSLVWARLRQRQAIFFFRLGRNQEAVALGEAVLPVLEAANDRLEMARCLLYMGNALRDMGEYDRAGGHYRRSAKLFAAVNDQLGVAAVENNLGVVSFYLEDLPGAIDHFEAALTARQAAGVEDTTLELGNIGLCLGELGRYNEAAEYLERSLALSLKLDARLNAGLSHHNLGNARRNLGQHQASADHIEEGVRLFRELGSRDALAAALADLASTYLELGRFAEAETALLEGLELEQALNRPRGIAFKHLGLGNLRLEEGDLDRAKGQFLQVIEVAGTDHGYSLFHGALVGLAVIKARSGDPESAGAVLEAITASDQTGAETRQLITNWQKRLEIVPSPGTASKHLDIEALVELVQT